MKVNAITLAKAQRGWLCGVMFYATTTAQFTDIYFRSEAVSRWPVLALIRAYLKARRHYREVAAKKGEREAMGWN
jgi:hypothetical protein